MTAEIVDSLMAGETDSRHEGRVHDVQFDYYGNRLATCAEDGNIHIFAVTGSEAPSFLHSFSA